MLLGISGKKRSGKDTSYELIKDILSEKGYTVKRYHFARVVKEFSKKYFGIDPNHPNKEEVRFIWQGVGQLLRDEVNRDYWIDKEYNQYLEDALSHKNLIGIITDVRYQNEAEFFVNRKFPLVRIVRPDFISYDSHPSEVELDTFKFNYMINNTNDIDYLKSQWEALCNQIF